MQHVFVPKLYVYVANTSVRDVILSDSTQCSRAVAHATSTTMPSQVPGLSVSELQALKKSGALDKTADEALQDLKAACIAFLILTTLFAIARFVSRIWIGRIRLWWDDYTILIAYICNIVICVIGLRKWSSALRPEIA